MEIQVLELCVPNGRVLKWKRREEKRPWLISSLSVLFVSCCALLIVHLLLHNGCVIILYYLKALFQYQPEAIFSSGTPISCRQFHLRSPK
jgi:hypothetical protein